MTPVTRDLLTEVREVLEATPASLRAMFGGAAGRMPLPSSGPFAFREKPGAWTPVQVLCHLVDGEVTDWVPRLELMFSDGGPKRFTPFDREAGFVTYAGWSIASLLTEFDRLRTANLSQLSRITSEADLERTGIHPEFGLVTVRQLLACWATHDMAHVAQISRTLVRYFGNQIGPWRRYFSLLQDDV